MTKKVVFSLAFGFSLISWSQVVMDDHSPRFIYQDQSFKLDWADVSDAAAERLFGDDTKRLMEIKNILSMRPDKKVNLKDYMSEVKNQGQRGTCSHFASIGLVEYFVDKNANYSEQCLAFFAGDTDSNGITKNISFIRTQGLYDEVQCPYVNPEDYNDWLWAKEEEQEKMALVARNTMPDLQHEAKKYPSFDVEMEYVDELSDGEYIRYILDKLDNGIPVGITLYVSGTEWQKGIITGIPTEEEIKKECKGEVNTSSIIKKCGTHSVILTGYDGKQGLIYFKNSWDKTWGVNNDFTEEKTRAKKVGYGVFSFAYLAKFRLGALLTLSN